MARTQQVICEFRFQCDKQWRDLNEISGQERVRYCGDCAKPVFLCQSYEELAEHVSEGHCVAVGENPDVCVTVGFVEADGLRR